MSDLDEFEEEPVRNLEDDLIETEVIKIRDPGDDLTKTTAITISDIDEAQQSGEPRSKASGTVRKKRKRRMKPAARIFLRVVLILSLCGCVFSGMKLYLGMRAYRESMNAYAELAAENRGPAETADDEGESVVYTPADFDKLAAINPDVIGWISLEGTVIDYPIVQGTDNEYYLEHLFTKEANHTGCVFLDVNNDPGFSDPSSILYAHHMRNGSMFAEIANYRKEGFLEEHPYLVLQTRDAVYKIEPFADILADAYGSYTQTSFESDTEFLEFVEDIRANSTFRTDEVITAEDRVVILSTCRYDVSDGRYAVMGKLKKIK